MGVQDGVVVFLHPGSYATFAVLMPRPAATACVWQKATGAVSQGHRPDTMVSVTSLLSPPSPLHTAVPGQGARRGTHGTEGCCADARALKDAAFRPSKSFLFPAEPEHSSFNRAAAYGGFSHSSTEQCLLFGAYHRVIKVSS